MNIAFNLELVTENVKTYSLLLSFLFILTTLAAAHPWGGLVVDEDGNIYFTFICPMSDDDHYACVWRLDNRDELQSILNSNASPSDIIMARSPKRNIFGAERTGPGSRHRSKLWQIGNGEPKEIIASTSDPGMFHIQAYTVHDDGTVYFARDEKLFRRATDGTVNRVELHKTITRIDAMAWGPGNRLYLIDRDKIHIHFPDGELRTLASGLKKENPEHLPFSGANILFDMAVDNSGSVYIAYFGNRSVLKVNPSGEVSTFLQAEGPWSPHGVDIFNGEVYVLESTIGGSPWWKFWGPDELVPRIRKVTADGELSTLFEYSE